MAFDQKQIEDLIFTITKATPDNLGDVLRQIIEFRKQIRDRETSLLAESLLTAFRGYVARAEQGWPLFAEPILPEQNLSDMH